MEDLFADQLILIEAVSELVMLTALMKVMGLNASGVETDLARLIHRLRVVNRKIDNGFD